MWSGRNWLSGTDFWTMNRWKILIRNTSYIRCFKSFFSSSFHMFLRNIIIHWYFKVSLSKRGWAFQKPFMYFERKRELLSFLSLCNPSIYASRQIYDLANISSCSTVHPSRAIASSQHSPYYRLNPRHTKKRPFASPKSLPLLMLHSGYRHPFS